MARDGSGVYTPPSGTTVTSNTTIESAPYNAFVADLTADANAARPITAGGTGAVTLAAAKTALEILEDRTFVTKSAGYTALLADKNVHIRFDGAYTLALTAVATLVDGWYCFVQADGGDVTIDPNGAETINGEASIIIPDNATVLLWSNGTVFLSTEDYKPAEGPLLYNAAQSLSASEKTQGQINLGGAILQEVIDVDGSVMTGTTLMPMDDTIPQITEGTEFLSLAITPISATSKLIIEVSINYSVSAAFFCSVALFKVGTSNALTAENNVKYTATYPMNNDLKHELTSGGTSEITFKVRAGPSNASTITVNGRSGARIFGGVMNSYIKITEISQ